MKTDSVPDMLARATERLLREFAHLPEPPAPTPEALAAMASVLDRTAQRLGDNYPYFHPLYAGQMLKPPHPVARAAYALAMLINPNNHARDGGRASSEMEIEAVRGIAAMFGWRGEFLGHLTSSGTIANLEALWVAGKSAEESSLPRSLAPSLPVSRILASAQAHYTHNRISAVLRLPFASVPTDDRGRMDLNALEDELRKGDVGAIVATLGTTAIGAVDPLPEILALARQYGARVHVDAAYGGYFKLIPDSLDEPARRAFAAIHEADSIVVDPHKHGLQPYGCGCVLFRDPAVGRFYKHDSPYTYFTSAQLHLGEISLECSRAGAAAVALWATQQLLPLIPGGEFAQGLAAGRRAALELDRRLRNSPKFAGLQAGPPELDIVVWGVLPSSAGLPVHAAPEHPAPDPSNKGRAGEPPTHPAAEPCNNGTASQLGEKVVLEAMSKSSIAPECPRSDPWNTDEGFPSTNPSSFRPISTFSPSCSAGPPEAPQSPGASAPAQTTPLTDASLKGHDFSRAERVQKGGGLQPLRDVSAPTPSLSSDRAQAIFDACAENDLHLALVQLPRRWFEASASETDMLTCLRSVLMKPEHEQWLDEIWRRLDEAAT